MPNKKFCKKCGDKHVPPTGRNCFKSSPVHQLQSSPVSLFSTEASQSTVMKTSSGDQAIELQQQILKQLHRVNSRLDTVEQDMVTVKQATHKQTDKISTFTKSKVSYSKMSTSESDDSSDDSLAPSLNVLKSKKSVQRKVDERLKQLQDDSAVKTGSREKFKSKRGGTVDCLVKNKIAWPQDTVLGGHSRQRVTYDQLSLTQWVQGFAKNIIEENCQDTKNTCFTIWLIS